MKISTPLLSILTSIPRIAVFCLSAWPSCLSWSRLRYNMQAGILSMCAQESVKDITLLALSNLPVSLFPSIIQHQQLTSLTRSHISLDQTDLVSLPTLAISPLTEIRKLALIGHGELELDRSRQWNSRGCNLHSPIQPFAN